MRVADGVVTCNRDASHRTYLAVRGVMMRPVPQPALFITRLRIRTLDETFQPSRLPHDLVTPVLLNPRAGNSEVWNEVPSYYPDYLSAGAIGCG